MGINARNFEPSMLASLRIRLLDGASTWKYLDYFENLHNAERNTALIEKP